MVVWIEDDEPRAGSDADVGVGLLGPPFGDLAGGVGGEFVEVGAAFPDCRFLVDNWEDSVAELGVFEGLFK